MWRGREGSVRRGEEQGCAAGDGGCDGEVEEVVQCPDVAVLKRLDVEREIDGPRVGDDIRHGRSNVFVSFTETAVGMRQRDGQARSSRALTDRPTTSQTGTPRLFPLGRLEVVNTAPASSPRPACVRPRRSAHGRGR